MKIIKEKHALFIGNDSFFGMRVYNCSKYESLSCLFYKYNNNNYNNNNNLVI